MEGDRRVGGEVMEAILRVLGEEHPSTLTSMNTLAWTWNYQNHHEKARELMTEVIQVNGQLALIILTRKLLCSLWMIGLRNR